MRSVGQSADGTQNRACKWSLANKARWEPFNGNHLGNRTVLVGGVSVSGSKGKAC